MKHVPKQPVSEFPPQSVGGGNLKQVPLGPVSLSTPHASNTFLWGGNSETGSLRICFTIHPPRGGNTFFEKNVGDGGGILKHYPHFDQAPTNSRGGDFYII